MPILIHIPYSIQITFFTAYPLEAEPYDFTAQSGVFEIRHLGHMTQTLDRPPIDTCRPLPMTHPIALIGKPWLVMSYLLAELFTFLDQFFDDVKALLEVEHIKLTCCVCETNICNMMY